MEISVSVEGSFVRRDPLQMGISLEFATALYSYAIPLRLGRRG
jgi:hypothetical protein